MPSTVPRNSRTRPLTVFAQDPGVLDANGRPLLTQIDVPAEQLAPGPCGYRIRVVDYDASSGTLYSPMKQMSSGHFVDRFEVADPADLLVNPQFHQQNVYAIAMRVLGAFESALETPTIHQVSRRQLAECLAEAAKDLLTICIRALDYIVPVHVTFADYLTGLLTADSELVANDNRYHYRQHVRESFLAYGIGSTASQSNGVRAQAREADHLQLDRTDYRAMMTNRDEMFRFIWENRALLGVSDEFYTEVTSVSPSVRVGPDGMLLFETIVEYVQSARLPGRQLVRRGFRRPHGMPGNAQVDLYGGGTLIFDVRGTLKFHIRSPIDDPEDQNERLQYNYERGVYRMNRAGSLSRLHESRSLGRSAASGAAEVWV